MLFAMLGDGDNMILLVYPLVTIYGQQILSQLLLSRVLCWVRAPDCLRDTILLPVKRIAQ